jgi:hypothetical protein
MRSEVIGGMEPLVRNRPPGRPASLDGNWVWAADHSSSAAAVLIGLATPWQLEWFGILYASEILLAVVALWALITHLTDTRFWQRPFTTLLACLGATLLAYVVADLTLGTETQNLARGWARNIFLTSNFIGLYFLSRRNPFNLMIYAISAAAGTLGYLALTGAFFDDWKFGASAPLTLLVACLIPLVTTRGSAAGPLALAALGLVHIGLDSREIGGNCLLAGVLLLAHGFPARRLKSLSWAVLGILLSAGVGILLYAYILTDAEYGQRRDFSNAWRTASLITAAGAISESPWLGYGSQANTFDLQSRYDSIFAEHTGIRYRGQRTDTSTFSPHSQILQSCFMPASSAPYSSCSLAGNWCVDLAGVFSSAPLTHSRCCSLSACCVPPGICCSVRSQVWRVWMSRSRRWSCACSIGNGGMNLRDEGRDQENLKRSRSGAPGLSRPRILARSGWPPASRRIARWVSHPSTQPHRSSHRIRRYRLVYRGRPLGDREHLRHPARSRSLAR